MGLYVMLAYRRYLFECRTRVAEHFFVTGVYRTEVAVEKECYLLIDILNGRA